MSAWNPRYMLYCVAQGRTPEAQQAHDRAAHPGAAAMPFLLWSEARWQEWRKDNGIPPHEALGPERIEAGQRWLAALVEPQQSLFAETAA